MTRAELIAALDAAGCKDDDEVFVYNIDEELGTRILDVDTRHDEDGEFVAIIC